VDSTELTGTTQPGLFKIFIVFTKIGLTSFGGGLSGWMMLEFVRNRRWLSETEFLSGLALAQAFPGVNVVNLAIWIGYRMGKGPGALVAVLGMVVPAMFVAIGVFSIYSKLARFHVTNILLAGIVAAAIGLSLQMGVRAARRAASSVVPIAIMVITFVAIFAFRLPLVLVVCVMAPVSITAAYLRLRNKTVAK